MIQASLNCGILSIMLHVIRRIIVISPNSITSICCESPANPQLVVRQQARRRVSRSASSRLLCWSQLTRPTPSTQRRQTRTCEQHKRYVARCTTNRQLKQPLLTVTCNQARGKRFSTCHMIRRFWPHTLKLCWLFRGRDLRANDKCTC